MQLKINKEYIKNSLSIWWYYNGEIVGSIFAVFIGLGLMGLISFIIYKFA